jgi:hypothetical protein
MKSTERHIYFYDLVTKAGSATLENPKAISVQKILELVGGLSAADRKLSRANSKRTYEITDWKSEGDRIAFLFRMSDTSIADPYFSDLRKGARRKAAKNGGEGHDFSSHIVVKIPADPIDPAVMLIERTTGITIPRVMTVLRILLRKARKKHPEIFHQVSIDGVVDEDGKPIKHLVNFWIEAEGHISQQLAEDINNGSISEVELITQRHKMQPFDGDAYLVNEENVLVLKVNKKHPGLKDKLTKLTQLFDGHKKEYEKARIKFKTARGTAGSLSWDADYGVSDRYLRKEVVTNIHPPMESSYAVFRSDLLVSMAKFLK